MAKGSDNPFPSLLLVETADASITTPAAGRRRLFVDTANVLKWKDEAGTVSTVGVPPGGTTGQVLTKASNNDGDLSWAAGGAGGSAWTQVITESGASFANFTAAAGGVWSSDGTVIKQTDTAAAQRRASHNTMASALKLVTCDIQLVTVNTGRGGLLLALPDAHAAEGYLVYITSGAIAFEFPESSAARGSFPATINAGTWYTLRCLHSGTLITVWLNGTLVGTREVGASGAAAVQDQRDTGLYTYGQEVWFRNYGVHTLTLP